MLSINLKLVEAEMIEFKVTDDDMRKIAEMVVKTSLNIQKGDCVYITGQSNNVEFMNLLAIECEKIGASSFERVNLPREAFHRVIKETPIENLKCDPKHYLSILDETDAQIIVLSLPSKEPIKYTEEEIKKITVYDESYGVLWDKITKDKIRLCAITIPGPEGNEVDQLLYDSLTTDLNYLSKVGNYLKKAIDDAKIGAKEIHVTCQAGSDFTLNVDKDPVTLDDGILDEEDYKEDFQVYLPGGVVCINGLKGTANGTIVIKEAYDQWNKRPGVINNLKLVFESGKIVESSSDTNYKIFEDTLNDSTGEKDMLCEFGIGTNPKVNKLVYQMKVDELMHGSVHIAIGDNSHCGGKIESDLHWDFVIPKATVYIDGVCVLKDGKFQFDRGSGQESSSR